MDIAREPVIVIYTIPVLDNIIYMYQIPLSELFTCHTNNNVIQVRAAYNHRLQKNISPKYVSYWITAFVPECGPLLNFLKYVTLKID